MILWLKNASIFSYIEDDMFAIQEDELITDLVNQI